MKSVTSPWTPEVLGRVKKMWREGISAARIGTMTGIARNAIIGKMHREGVQTPNTQRARRPALARKPDRPRITAPKAPRPPRLFLIGNGPQSSARKPPSLPVAGELPSEPAPLNVSFLELADGMCKWPVGAGHHRYCGHPSVPGRSYCPYHGKAMTAKGIRALKAAVLDLPKSA